MWRAIRSKTAARVEEEQHPYYKWVVVGIIWLVACLNYTDRMTIFSVFPVLKKELSLSDITLALIGSSFLWVYGIFSPVGGYFRGSLLAAQSHPAELAAFQWDHLCDWSRANGYRIDRAQVSFGHFGSGFPSASVGLYRQLPLRPDSFTRQQYCPERPDGRDRFR